MSGSDLTDADIAHMLGWQPSIFTRREGTMSAQIRAIADEAARREREACAKVCDKGAGLIVDGSDWAQGYDSASRAHGAAIRARSEV